MASNRPTFHQLSHRGHGHRNRQPCQQQKLLENFSTQIDLNKKTDNLQPLNLFVTYHTMDFDPVNIVGDLRKSFRPMTFQEEHMDKLIDTKLQVDGFSNFELLRAIWRTIRSIKAKG